MTQILQTELQDQHSFNILKAVPVKMEEFVHLEDVFVFGVGLDKIVQILKLL